MAINNKEIISTGTDIFPPTSPVLVAGEYAVTTVMFCNVSGSDVDLTVHILPSTSAGIALENKVINTLTIPAGETFTFDTEKVILNEADRIHAVASANNRLVATVSYMRVS